MDVFYTKLYNHNQENTMKKYYEAAETCGFREISLYANADMNIDDYMLKAQIDGSLAKLDNGGKVIVSFPTGMGERYDHTLLTEIKKFPNADIILNLYSYKALNEYSSQNTSVIQEDLYDVIIVSDDKIDNDLLAKCLKTDKEVCINREEYKNTTEKLLLIKAYIDSLAILGK